MSVIRSRDNARVRRWRQLTRDARMRRQERRALIEGSKLLSACLDSGRPFKDLILSETASTGRQFDRLLKRSGTSPTVLSDPVFRSVADAETPVGIAAEIELPESQPDPAVSAGCVFLDGIQDAGNVGAILRSAAAFGVPDAVLGRGCADPWSPKVFRAAMGAHFAIGIVEAADLAAEIAGFGGTIICAVPRGGAPLKDAVPGGRIGWIFGAEGKGVSDALASLATLRVSIPMPGAAESLNVAAAAAICFYEAARAFNRPGVRS